MTSPHPTIKAVLFDLDDTLWPIAPAIARAEIVLRDWMVQHAPSVYQQHTIESLRARRMELMQATPHFRVDVWSLRHTVLCEVLTACGEDLAKADLAMEIFSNARNVVDLFDDVLPVLSRLSGKLALGSISNGFADLDAIGMAQHFKVSLAAHRCGTAKPDPAIFLMACEALHIAPAEAIYVGDDLLLDVEGAQKAGLRAVWMNRFARDISENVRPDAICTNLAQLEQWLALD